MNAMETTSNRNELSQMVGEAWTAFRSNQHAYSIKTFEQVLAQDRDHIDALYGLGLVLRASGHIDGARTHWERALQISESLLSEMGDERTARRERVFMTSSMLQQRLAEIS
jgi:Tfp pilus assembly protein PilF